MENKTGSDGSLLSDYFTEIEQRPVASFREELLLVARPLTTDLIRDVVPRFLAKYSSQNTIESYLRSLKSFFLFWELAGAKFQRVSEISDTHINIWQTSLRTSENTHGKKPAPSTVNAKTAAICAFVGYAYKRKLIASNPVDFVSRKNETRTRGATPAFTEVEIQSIHTMLKERLDTHAAGSTAGHKAWLEYTVFSTLCTVGMRASELCGLKKSDLTNNAIYPVLKLDTKGGRRESKGIPDTLFELLSFFIKRFRTYAEAKDPLFAMSDFSDKPISREYVTRLVGRLAKEAGIEKSRSAHSCRVGVGTILANHNVPLHEIQELLGHKSIHTTSLYLRTGDEAPARRIQILDISNLRGPAK